MTRKLDKSKRTGFVFVSVLGGMMAAILGGLYFMDLDTDAQRVRNVAMNLHIENTTCANVQLALEQNELSIKDRIVRDELNRVLEEGNCNGETIKVELFDGIGISDKVSVVP